MQCIRNLTQFLLKHIIRQSSKNHGSRQQGYCAFSLPTDLLLEAGSSKLAWFQIVSLNYTLKCRAQFKGESSVGREGRTGLVHSVFRLICSAKVQISRYLCKGFLATFNLVACISGDSEKPASRMRFWGNYRSGISGSPNSGGWLKMKLKPCTEGLKKNCTDFIQCLSPEQCNYMFIKPHITTAVSSVGQTNHSLQFLHLGKINLRPELDHDTQPLFCLVNKRIKIIF